MSDVRFYGIREKVSVSILFCEKACPFVGTVVFVLNKLLSQKKKCGCLLRMNQRIFWWGAKRVISLVARRHTDSDSSETVRREFINSCLIRHTVLRAERVQLRKLAKHCGA